MGTGLRWEVADHATATAVLACRELTRTPPAAAPPLTAHLLNCEGRAHHALRAAVRAALDRALPRAAVQTARLAAELLDARADEFDAAAGWIRPMVLGVLAAALGLPDHEVPYWHRVVSQADTGLPEVVAAEVTSRVGRLVDERKATPRADVISAIAAAEDATREERIATAFFTLHAGYLNTATMLGRALLALAQHPAEYTWLRSRNPVPSTAVDELLRFAQVPERASMRVAPHDVALAGLTVPAGTRIYVRRALANRDEGRYADPQRLDLRRATSADSLAFGAGRHRCPATEFVRVTVATALTVLVRAVREIRSCPRTDHEWDFARPLYLVFDAESDRRTP